MLGDRGGPSTGGYTEAPPLNILSTLLPLFFVAEAIWSDLVQGKFHAAGELTGLLQLPLSNNLRHTIFELRPFTPDLVAHCFALRKS